MRQPHVMFRKSNHHVFMIFTLFIKPLLQAIKSLIKLIEESGDSKPCYSDGAESNEFPYGVLYFHYFFLKNAYNIIPHITNPASNEYDIGMVPAHVNSWLYIKA